MSINWIRPVAAALATVLATAGGAASAAPVDFTQFLVESYPLTGGFPEAIWKTTPTEARLDDENPFASAANASVNVFYGPDSALGKRFVGQLAPGNGVGVDDDVVGFVLGWNPGDNQYFSTANYLLVDWKGVTQNFDFGDPAGGDFFHGATTGGEMPVGLALSRVTGLPTADELWQHVDSEDGIDGGVVELARARTLGDRGYNRDPAAAPHVFDITYTSNRVTVIVDGVLQFDEQGSFGDGRFGLYTLSQGPTPVYSNFEVLPATSLPSAFPEVTVDRATGRLSVRNPGTQPIQFTSYSISSEQQSLAPDQWSSISANYDGGGAGSVDSDAWTVGTSSSGELAEAESGGSNGATLAAGQTLNLGNVWTRSQFEDLVVLFELPGLTVPVVPQFTGNGGAPYQRADLNADGLLNLADWQLFYANSLATFDGLSPTSAALRGDLDLDGDNDVSDFALFKADYDAVNGTGAFAAMVAAVPEPSTGLLVLLAGALGAWRRRLRNSVRGRELALASVVAVAASALPQQQAGAQPVDFTTFTLEAYPQINFATPAWDLLPTYATITAGANTSPSVVYSPFNVQGKRIRGFLEPGTDDDVVGILLGFQPGDATPGPDSADADYLMIDWKGVTQNFDFVDPPNTAEPFNGLTGTGVMPAGLALSRVTGLANMDEMWQHRDLDGNPAGGVEELARGFTLGQTGYDRSGANSPPTEFDIVFTATQIVVRADGVLQFNQRGNFSDGRLAMYTCCQSESPTFSDFEILDISTLDELVLAAEVDRGTGDVTIRNNTSGPLDIDFLQLESESGSLLTSWQGLADSETGANAAAGLGWVEAGAASTQAIAELFLADSAGNMNGRTLASGSQLTLSGAYNPAVDGQDLLFSYRLPTGVLDAGVVTYVGEPIGGGPGDFNADGKVDGGDLAAWEDQFGAGRSGADLLAWQRGFGSSATPAVTGVPEPAAGLLLTLGMWVAIGRRRR